MKIVIDGITIQAETASQAVSALRAMQWQTFETNAEYKEEMTNRFETITGETITFESPMHLLQQLEEYGFIEIHDDTDETSSETESPNGSQKPD